MENIAICGKPSESETIRREEHPAIKTGEQLPSTTTRNERHFVVTSLYDYYLLGYSTADGCLLWYPERYQYGIKWSSIDRDIIERIRSRFDNDGNITLQKCYSENHSQVYVYTLNGKGIASDFMSYGILPRKTYDPLFPNGMTKEQTLAFVAGLIDGDGCWWFSKTLATPVLNQSIRSYSSDFLRKVQDALKIHINIIGVVCKDESSPRLLYASRAALILYENLPKEFGCIRKNNVVEEFVKIRGGWDNIKKICKECGTRFIKYRHNQTRCENCYKKEKAL